jgi:ankyrin repeat protein
MPENTLDQAAAARHRVADDVSVDDEISSSAGSEIVEMTDSTGQTALHRAVITGALQVAENLLIHGHSVGPQDVLQNQPLHYAVLGGSEKLVQLLLKRRADVNAPGDLGRRPLHLCLRFPKVLKAVLHAGPHVSATDFHGDTALHLAYSSNGTEKPAKGSIIERLIRSGADVNVVNRAGSSPFHMLLEKSQMSGLYSHEYIALFLENGADLSLKTVRGELPFPVFIDNSNFRWSRREYLRSREQFRRQNVLMFLKRGADPNLKLQSGQTLLNATICEGILDSEYEDDELGMLLARSANHEIAGLEGKLPLHCLLERAHHSKTVRSAISIFLDLGAGSNSRDQAGNTSLMTMLSHFQTYESFRKNSKDVIDLLLQHGADPMICNNAGELPMSRLFEFCNGDDPTRKECLQMLVDATKDAQPVEKPNPEQEWWQKYLSFYQFSTWLSPLDLITGSFALPEAHREAIHKTSLEILAEKFLFMAKKEFLYHRDEFGVRDVDAQKSKNEMVRILKDCIKLKISVEQTWFHFLLEFFD